MHAKWQTKWFAPAGQRVSYMNTPTVVVIAEPAGVTTIPGCNIHDSTGDFVPAPGFAECEGDPELLDMKREFYARESWAQDLAEVLGYARGSLVSWDQLLADVTSVVAARDAAAEQLRTVSLQEPFEQRVFTSPQGVPYKWIKGSQLGTVMRQVRPGDSSSGGFIGWSAKDLDRAEAPEGLEEALVHYWPDTLRPEFRGDLRAAIERLELEKLERDDWEYRRSRNEELALFGRLRLVLGVG